MSLLFEYMLVVGGGLTALLLLVELVLARRLKSDIRLRSDVELVRLLYEEFWFNTAADMAL